MTRHENLVNALDNSARYSMMSKGKNVSNVLANGFIFSTLNTQTQKERESIKMQAVFFFVFGRQNWVKVLGVPSVDRGNRARESCRRVRKQRSIFYYVEKKVA